MTTENTTQDCPYCKEEIMAGAVKCKHCGSKLAATKPSHEGICPYCKEEILIDAIKCKHCKSSLLDSKDKSGCGCGEESETPREPNDSVAFRAGFGRINPWLTGGNFGWTMDDCRRVCTNYACGAPYACGSNSDGTVMMCQNCQRMCETRCD